MIFLNRLDSIFPKPVFKIFETVKSKVLNIAIKRENKKSARRAMDKALKDMEKSPNDSNRTKGQPSRGEGNKKR